MGGCETGTLNSIIGVDLDGCVVDFCAVATAELNKRLHTNYSLADRTEYDCEPLWGKEIATVWHDISHEPETYARAQPIEGAIPVLKHIHRIAEIWFLTSRPKEMRSVTEHWLKRHDVPYEELAFTNSKHLWATAYGMEATIEDKLETAIKLSECVGTSILLDQPYNRKPACGIVRCKDWTEILKVLLEKL